MVLLVQVVGMLSFIKDTMWKTMFGKQADSLERVTEKDDECENIPHLKNQWLSVNLSRASLTLLHSQIYSHRAAYGRHDP